VTIGEIFASVTGSTERSHAALATRAPLQVNVKFRSAS
jgi:hypothetical protein